MEDFMASDDSYMASIDFWGANFAPRSWSFCEGQLLSIAQYSALFSLLGTTFGGDGRTTFGLPDLRGRVAVGVGSGPGLTPVYAGQAGGSEQVALSQGQLASHSHGVQEDLTGSLKASNRDATSNTPGSNVVLAKSSTNYLVDSGQKNTEVAGPGIGGSITVQATGDGSPHENRQPYLGLRAIICLNGIYPPRN
jgi:microcystin-dependent protein